MPHDRPPRRYRGCDFVWWLGVLNRWDADAPKGADHTTIADEKQHAQARRLLNKLAARMPASIVTRAKAYRLN